MTTTPEARELQNVLKEFQQFDSTKFGGEPSPKKKAKHQLQQLAPVGSPTTASTIFSPTFGSNQNDDAAVFSPNSYDDDDEGTEDSFFASHPHLLNTESAAFFDTQSFASAISESIEKLRDKSDLVFTRRRQAQQLASERMKMQQMQSGGGGGPRAGRRATLGAAGRRMSSVSSSQRSTNNLSSMRRTQSSLSRGSNSKSPSPSGSPSFGTFGTNSGGDLFGKICASGAFENDDDDILGNTMRSSGHGSSASGLTARPGAEDDDDDGQEEDDAPAGMEMKRFEDFFWRFTAKDKIPSKKMIKILLQRAHVTPQCKTLLRVMLDLDDESDDHSPSSVQQKQQQQQQRLLARQSLAKDDSSDPDIEDSARKHHQQQREKLESNSTLLNNSKNGGSSSSNNNPALGDAPEAHVMIDSAIKLLDAVSTLTNMPWLDLPQLPPKSVTDVAEFWKDLQRYATEMSLCVHDTFWMRTAVKRQRNELRAAREVACLLVSLAAVIQFRRHKVRAAVTAVASSAAQNRGLLAAASAASAAAAKEAEKKAEDGKAVKGLPCLRFMLSTSCGIVVSSEAALQQMSELFPGIELDEDEERKKREEAAEKKRQELMAKLELEATGGEVFDDTGAAASDDGEEAAARRKKQQQKRKKRRLSASFEEMWEQNHDEENEKNEEATRLLLARRKKKVIERRAADTSQRLLHNLFEKFTTQLRQLRVDEVAEHQAAFPGEQFVRPQMITVHKSSIFDMPHLMENFPGEIRTLTYDHLSSSSVKAAQNQVIDNNPLLKSGTVQLPALRQDKIRLTTPSASSVSTPPPRIAARRSSSSSTGGVDSGEHFFLTSVAHTPQPTTTTSGGGANNNNSNNNNKTVAVIEPSRTRRNSTVVNPTSSSSSVLHLKDRSTLHQQHQCRRHHSLQLVPMTPALSQQHQQEQHDASTRRRRMERSGHSNLNTSTTTTSVVVDSFLHRCAATPSPTTTTTTTMHHGTASSSSFSLTGGPHHHHHHRCVTPASYLSPMDLPQVPVPTGPFQQHVRVGAAAFEKSKNMLGRALNCMSPGMETPSSIGQARALRSRLRQLG